MSAKAMMAEKGMQVMSGKLGAFASALLASCFFGAVDVSPYMRSSADELPCGAVPSERQLAREKMDSMLKFTVSFRQNRGAAIAR